MSALDPFYLVKEEVQDSVREFGVFWFRSTWVRRTMWWAVCLFCFVCVQVVKVQVTLQRWEQLPASAAEREVLHKELLSACESIEWQVRQKESSHYLDWFQRSRASRVCHNANWREPFFLWLLLSSGTVSSQRHYVFSHVPTNSAKIFTSLRILVLFEETSRVLVTCLSLNWESSERMRTLSHVIRAVYIQCGLCRYYTKCKHRRFSRLFLKT
jgi:hypothetical protein